MLKNCDITWLYLGSNIAMQLWQLLKMSPVWDVLVGYLTVRNRESISIHIRHTLTLYSKHHISSYAPS